MQTPSHGKARELCVAAFPAGRWDGQHLWVGAHGLAVRLRPYSSRGKSGVQIHVPLDPPSLPVRAWLTPTNAVTLGGPPAIVLGDAAFDARWRLTGTPNELVVRGLTPEVRAALAQCPPEIHIDVRDGEVETRAPRSVGPDALRSVVDALARFALQLSRGYRDEVSEHGRVGGELAVQAAHQAWQAQLDAAARGDSVGAFITLAFVLVFLLTIAVIVGLVVFLLP